MAFEPIAYETATEDELIWEIDVHWEVFGADSRKIGMVRDVQPYHLVVRNGRFRAEELVVPVTCITDVRHEHVYLSVTRADLEAQQAELAAAATGDVDALVREDYDPEMTIQLAVPSDLGPSPAVAEAPALPPLDAEPRVVRHLVANSPAAVNLAAERPIAPDAPDGATIAAGLNADELRVQRRLVTAQYSLGGVSSAPFAELDIYIPIRGEEELVSKRPVVREVVEIGKTLHERDRRVSDTVHRERIVVERQDGFPFPAGEAAPSTLSA